MTLGNLPRNAAIDTIPNGTCYSITGLASPFNDYTYVPCNLTAIENGQHSACCAPGDTCLTNGLCKYNSPTPVRNFNTYWRIGCTDPTYQDPACPKQCKNVEKVERHVHVVFECPGDEQWCCGTGSTDDYQNTLTVNTTCCNIPDLAFSGEARESYTTALKDWKADLDVQTFAVLSAAAGTASAVTSSLAALSTTLPTITNASTTRPTSTQTQASALASPATTSLSPSSSSSNTVALGVGLSLGIPLLISLVLLFSFVLYRYRRRSNDKHERIGEESHGDVRHAHPHSLPLEKSGREVPAELSADKGPFEVWTPAEPGDGREGDRWRRGADVYL